MTDISIVQAHSLSREQARAAAQRVADKMARDYSLACAWNGDVLKFERVGVQGTLTLQGQRAEMVISLGFPMSMMSAAIESKVADNMRKVFAGG